MTQETNPAKILRLLQAMLSWNEPALKELLHPDVVIVEPPSVPYPGTWRGLDGIQKFFGRLAEVFAAFQPAPPQVIGEPSGDMFAVLHRIHVKSAKTGRTADIEVLEMYTFRDGRVIEIKPYYFDTKALADLCA